MISIDNIEDISINIYNNSNNWMEKLATYYPSWGEKTLNKIIVPGTHNSGTGYMKNNNYYFHNYKYLSRLVRLGLKIFSENQNYTITEQLNTGIRYLDIRPKIDNDIIYLSHHNIIIEYKFDDCINEIINFLTINKQEIIIMFINHINDTKINDFLEKKLENIKSYCIDNNPNIFKTKINEIMKSDKRLFIVYEDYNNTNSNNIKKYTFSNNYLDSYWKFCNNYDNIAKNKNDIEKYLECYKSVDKNKLKTLQLHINYDYDNLIYSALYFTNNIETNGYKINQYIMNLITTSDNIKNNNINIIEMDFYNNYKINNVNILTTFIYANLLSISNINIKNENYKNTKFFNIKLSSIILSYIILLIISIFINLYLALIIFLIIRGIHLCLIQLNIY